MCQTLRTGNKLIRQNRKGTKKGRITCQTDGGHTPLFYFCSLPEGARSKRLKGKLIFSYILCYASFCHWEPYFPDGVKGGRFADRNPLFFMQLTLRLYYITVKSFFINPKKLYTLY